MRVLTYLIKYLIQALKLWLLYNNNDYNFIVFVLDLMRPLMSASPPHTFPSAIR